MRFAADGPTRVPVTDQPTMTEVAALAEVGWVAREAQSLIDSWVPEGSPGRAAWQARSDEHALRKQALLDHIEAKKVGRSNG